MIISASRRTDIPAHYLPWFIGRLRAGYALVPNPMNPRQVRRVPLDPESVEGIVFWSKNPEPLLSGLGDIEAPWYLHYTLNAYAGELERHLPPLAQRVDTFRRLADMVGPERILWRYDPILITDECSVAWHLERFDKLAEALKGYTQRCVFSFLDPYRKIKGRMAAAGMRPPSAGEERELGLGMLKITGEARLKLESCCETLELAGVDKGRCVDAELLGRIAGKSIAAGRDRNQRLGCGCACSVDVGMYDTCPNGCLYCYANYRDEIIARNMGQHRADGEMLVGMPVEGTRIVVGERGEKAPLKPRSEQLGWDLGER